MMELHQAYHKAREVNKKPWAADLPLLQQTACHTWRDPTSTPRTTVDSFRGAQGRDPYHKQQEGRGVQQGDSTYAMNQELFETLMESSQVSADEPANEQEESLATSGMVALRGAPSMLSEHLTLIRKRKKRTREDMFCRIFHPLQPSEQGLGGPI